MTELHWITIREDAITTWGETPGAQLEAEIIAQFTNEPQRVIRAIEHVKRRHATGKITTSCWGVLRAELRERPAVDAAANDATEKAKAIRRADTYIRNSLIHYDRDTEVEDELFGDRGLLRPWADDIALRGRMLTLWRELRPKGEQLEQDALDRAEHWKTSTGALLAQRRTIQHQAAIDELVRRSEPEPALAPEPTLEPQLSDEVTC